MAKFTRPIFLGTPARLPPGPDASPARVNVRPEAPPPPASSQPPTAKPAWTAAAQQRGAQQAERFQQGVKSLQRGLRDVARSAAKAAPPAAPAPAPGKPAPAAPAPSQGRPAPASGQGRPASSPSPGQGKSTSGDSSPRAGAPAGSAQARGKSEPPASPPLARGGALGGRSGGDGFGVPLSPRLARPPALATPPGELPPVVVSASDSSALQALNQAQPPGVYFREQSRDQGQTEDDEDPELAAAVEEAIRLLFGVRGIHHIGPGYDDTDTPVIVIAVSRGFASGSLAAIPERVHRFRTVVAVPYEMLPLRQER